MRMIKIVLVLLIIVVSFRCSTTDPEVKEESSLTVTDVSCTEVWLSRGSLFCANDNRGKTETLKIIYLK